MQKLFLLTVLLSTLLVSPILADGPDTSILGITDGYIIAQPQNQDQVSILLGFSLEENAITNAINNHIDGTGDAIWFIEMWFELNDEIIHDEVIARMEFDDDDDENTEITDWFEGGPLDKVSSATGCPFTEDVWGSYTFNGYSNYTATHDECDELVDVYVLFHRPVQGMPPIEEDWAPIPNMEDLKELAHKKDGPAGAWCCHLCPPCWPDECNIALQYTPLPFPLNLTTRVFANIGCLNTKSNNQCSSCVSKK